MNSDNATEREGVDSYEMFRERNPHLSPAPRTRRREMTAWSYSSLRDLIEGNDEFVIYVEQADHRALFFSEHGRVWLFNQPPKGGFDQLAPEVIEDLIGASAPKEPGAEPVLMHRDELPKTLAAIIEHVTVTEPTHVYEELKT